MNNIPRYEPDWNLDNYPSLDAVSVDPYGRMIYIDDLLSWIEDHRPHMGDAQVLIKLVEELRR
jgi:hypothetical protein